MNICKKGYRIFKDLVPPNRCRYNADFGFCTCEECDFYNHEDDLIGVALPDNIKRLSDFQLGERNAARDILNIIERVCLSEEYMMYRFNQGSNGIRDLIISSIKEKYNP